MLLKTPGPVVHVCLCEAQLTFGILAFQTAAQGTSWLPPKLDGARHLMLDKTFKPHAYGPRCALKLLGTWWTQTQKSLGNDALCSLLHTHTYTHIHIISRYWVLSKKQTTETGNLISCSATLNSISPYLPRHAGICGCSDCTCS